MDLTDRLGGFVLQHKVAGAIEGATFGIDVNVGFDGDDLRLRNTLILLPVAFVLGLYAAAILGCKVLVQDMSVVVISCSTTGGY
jgi:hypothetical protein